MRLVDQTGCCLLKISLRSARAPASSQQKWQDLAQEAADRKSHLKAVQLSTELAAASTYLLQ